MSIEHPAADAPSLVLQATKIWLERAVVGLNLCPFAKAVLVKGQLRMVVSPAETPEALLEDLVRELRLLALADPQVIDTTVLVHPGVLTDFLEFNDFLDRAEAALADLDLEGVLQIASFHPQFRFADAGPDDMGNFSNRSPFPTLHLLREDSISRAVEVFPEAEMIYERNIATLEALGPEGWRRLFDL